MGAASKHQILLVDDEPQILVALEDLLADQFKVLTATSAEAALRLMEKCPDVAVVVTDQRMPNMPGDEFVSRLSGSYDCQRIMVTGYADLSAVVRAVNEGRIFAYVTKPWNETDLRQKVTKAAEQFRLSQELANEKKLLDDLMNHSPDGVYFKNSELQFVRANQVAASWFGQGVDALVGKKLTELRPSLEGAREIELEERQSLLNGAGILDAVRAVNVAGKTRWISERKAPIRAPSGGIVGLVGISRDITEQKELEQQLRHAQKMEAVGRLAGGVAHDFNNLLVIIQGYADLIHDRLEEDSPGRADIQELLSATDRAAALTRQLLTFSRKTPVASVALDLNQVVSDLEKMLSRLVDASVRMETNLQAGLPKTRGDMTQFEQVVLNLVINARDAMPDGGILTISTTQARMSFKDAREEADYLCLSVRDTGIGMNAEVQARIFEPFFSTKEVGKGTGLGLSTVYGIVHQWGGQIRVESELGSGTCFSVYFPVVLGLVDAPLPRPENPMPTTGEETILLVEDDPAVRQVTARVLREKGYTVLEAGSPSEARAKFSQSPVDLLLSDVNMPETSGFRLAEELVEASPELRVLFMSGYTKGELSTTARHAPLLDKPFSPEKLTLAVRAALSGANGSN